MGGGGREINSSLEGHNKTLFTAYPMSPEGRNRLNSPPIPTFPLLAGSYSLKHVHTSLRRYLVFIFSGHVVKTFGIPRLSQHLLGTHCDGHVATDPGTELPMPTTLVAEPQQGLAGSESKAGGRGWGGLARTYPNAPFRLTEENLHARESLHRGSAGQFIKISSVLAHGTWSYKSTSSLVPNKSIIRAVSL